MRVRSALALLLLSLLLADVARGGTPAPDDPGERVGVLRYEQRLLRGAERAERLPMVIGLHGAGGGPGDLEPLLSRLPCKARVILLEGPTEWKRGGIAWFSTPRRTSNDFQISRMLTRATNYVADAIGMLLAKYPTLGRPFVVGSCQGAMVALSLAAHHGDLVSAVWPIAGALPPPSWPGPNGQSQHKPPIWAVHGDQDEDVPYRLGVETVQRFRAVGYDAELRSFPGIDHRITSEMEDVVLERLIPDVCGGL